MADIHTRIAEAKIECAKFALAFPGSTPEGAELIDARRGLEAAKKRLEMAQARWDRLIGPAEGWVPNPLKEQQ